MNLELASIKVDKETAGAATARLMVDGHHVMDVTFDPTQDWPALVYSGHRKAAELYEAATQEFTRPGASHAHLHAFLLDRFLVHQKHQRQSAELKEIEKLIKNKTVYYVHEQGQNISQLQLSDYTIIDTKFARKVAVHLRESYALFDKLVYILNERFETSTPNRVAVAERPGQIQLGLAV